MFSFVSLFPLFSCVDTTCGPGTVEVDGACVPADSGGDTDSDSDSDSDSDADTDTDTDADTDTDTDTEFSLLVCGDGSGDFTEIQAAIEAAPSGAVIGVCPGTYGPVVAESGVDVSVVGVEGYETTTIFGGKDSAVAVLGGTLSLSGFSIRGTGRDASHGGALHVDQGSLTVANSRVNESGGEALVVVDPGDITLDGNLFKDNSGGRMFYFYGGGNVVLTHNQVIGGTFQSGISAADIHLQGENNLFSGLDLTSEGLVFDGAEFSHALYNNVFEDIHVAEVNAASVIAVFLDFRNNIVADCDMALVYDAGYSIFWNTENLGTSGDGVLFADPRFTDAAGRDFTLRAGYSPAIDAGDPRSQFDDVDGTRNDMGIYGGPQGSW